ncbi:GSCOCG00002823001-RA-CDS [Cotesia congregata]|nr:GSCOCG00002823001-RA-CDS [Cotesia congregata]
MPVLPVREQVEPRDLQSHQKNPPRAPGCCEPPLLNKLMLNKKKNNKQNWDFISHASRGTPIGGRTKRTTEKYRNLIARGA